MFVCFPVGTFAAEHCDSRATAYQPRIIRCDFKRRAIPKLITSSVRRITS